MEDDKAQLKRIEDLEKRITQERMRQSKKRAEDLQKQLEKNLDERRKFELDQLKKRTIDQTDYEIEELKRHWDRQRQLHVEDTEKLKEIDNEYLQSITELNEQKAEQTRQFYAERGIDIQRALDSELEQFKNDANMQEAVRDKYAIQEEKLQFELDEKLLELNRQQAAQEDTAQLKAAICAEIQELKRAAWGSKQYDTVLRAIDRECKLFGLDAPAKSDVNLTAQEPVRIIRAIRPENAE
jgi:hypothetical protein